MWLPQTDSLSDTYRTVAPDLPGHGARADESFRFEEAVDTVEAFVQCTNGECIVLVGQSLGGYVAIEVAARNPDLVSGLVLSGSSADYRGWLGLRTRISSLMFRLGAHIPPVTAWFERTTCSRLRSLPLPDSTVDSILNAGLSLDAWGQAGLALVERDFPERLESYPGPVLLLNGENDRINRPAAVERSVELSDVSVVAISNAGHTVNLERPDIYTRVVREFVVNQCTEVSPDVEPDN
jgi:pimeloyl-ACP methyl ester carboxylesterase